MHKIKQNAILLAAIFLFLYLLPLGTRDLLVPDETRYAEIPREMITSGDWVAPHLNGLRYFEKPPLGYWINAGAILLFGENNFAVRLPSALIELDTISREVKAGGDIVQLTPKEFAILEFLLYNKNRAVSRFNLAEHVWGEDFDPFTMSNYIDVHIKNLRRKIGDNQGTIIHTVRGVGYIIKEKEDDR